MPGGKLSMARAASVVNVDLPTSVFTPGSCPLFAEEFFEGGEFGFGHVQIIFGGLGVLLLHGGLGFGDVGLHALLGGDDVAAEAIARDGLLFLQVVQGLRHGGGAAVDVVVEFLDFVCLCGGFGLSLRVSV